MFIYIGSYWVPFPSSEYGGSWVVIAENEGQCIDFLKEITYDDSYDHLIPNAVAQADVFQLDENVSNSKQIGVVDYFFT